MSKKHTYTIVWNQTPSQGFTYTYTFQRISDITITVDADCAKAEFTMGTVKDFEDFITFKAKYFRDMYRKVLLCHLVKQKRGMKVNTITITIDDKTQVYDKNTEHFPFMYSLLEDKPLNLTQNWGDTVLKNMLELKKTAQDTDRYSSCAFSFLESFGRTYPIDRFLNLWTSMNSYYGCIGKQYMEKCRNVFGNAISEEDYEVLSFEDNDAASINVLIALYTKNYDFWFSSKEYSIGTINQISNHLLEATGDTKKQLVSDIREYRKNNKAPFERDFRKLNDDIYEKFGLEPHCWFTFAFPYILRNKYFHGGLSAPIFVAYNDPDNNYLDIVSDIMERFLSEEIPNLINKKTMDDTKFRTVFTYLYNRSYKTNRSLSDNAKNRLKEYLNRFRSRTW